MVQNNLKTHTIGRYVTYNWTASPVVSRPCVYLLLLQSLLYLYARLVYQERRMLFVYWETDYSLSDDLTKPKASKLLTGNFRNISKALLVFIKKEKLQDCSSENVEENAEISFY